MASLRLGSGSISVVMSDALEQLARRALEQTMPGLVDELDRASEDIHRDAVAGWPVRTGRSRDSLRQEVVVAPDWSQIRARVIAGVPYAKYIVSPKVSGSGSAYVELLRKPTAERVRSIGRALVDRAVTTLEGG